MRGISIERRPVEAYSQTNRDWVVEAGRFIVMEIRRPWKSGGVEAQSSLMGNIGIRPNTTLHQGYLVYRLPGTDGWIHPDKRIKYPFLPARIITSPVSGCNCNFVLKKFCLSFYINLLPVKVIFFFFFRFWDFRIAVGSFGKNRLNWHEFCRMDELRGVVLVR